MASVEASPASSPRQGEAGPQRPDSVVGALLWLVAVVLLGGYFLSFVARSVELAWRTWGEQPGRSIVALLLSAVTVSVFAVAWRGSRSRGNTWWRVSADACVRAGALSVLLAVVTTMMFTGP